MLRPMSLPAKGKLPILPILLPCEGRNRLLGALVRDFATTPGDSRVLLKDSGISRGCVRHTSYFP
jgi:hypothetical protein